MTRYWLLGFMLLVSTLPAAVTARAADAESFLVASAPREGKEARDVLDGYLRKFDPRLHVRDCGTLVYSHPGSAETIYGGACRLNTGVDVTVCGDTGVGEFALSRGAATGEDAVKRFAATNCPGG